MSEKMQCPGCESYTSSVLADFEDGEPCRYCQLPHEATVAIVAARRRSADAELTRRFEEAITRATKSEQEVRRVCALVADMRDVLDRFEKRESP